MRTSPHFEDNLPYRYRGPRKQFDRGFRKDLALVVQYESHASGDLQIRALGQLQTHPHCPLAARPHPVLIRPLPAIQGTSSRAPTCRAHTPNPAPLARPRCSVTALHATDSPPSPAGNEQFSFRSTPIACCAAVRTAYGAPFSAHQMHCSSARLKRTAQPGRGLTATALLPHGARRNKSVHCALPAIQRRAAARTDQASHDEESHSKSRPATRTGANTLVSGD